MSITSNDLLVYSFIAVMTWCLVLTLVDAPFLTIVSDPVVGCEEQRKENNAFNRQAGLKGIV